VRIDLAEIALSPQGDGYRWEGEAWTGDVDRLLLRTRGEGRTGGRLEQGEIEAGWSHALGRGGTFRGGQDIRPTPARTHAMIGFEGCALSLRCAGFGLSVGQGQFTARFEGSLDQRITRRLVLQPRAELNFAGPTCLPNGSGRGSGARKWACACGTRSTAAAPYVGYSWDWATGRTADYRRADGDRVANRAVVIGVRAGSETDQRGSVSSRRG
jgi:copper resistance protein B